MTAREGTLVGEAQRAWMRFWTLRWRWKGPILAVVFLTAMGGLTSAIGNDDEPEVAQAEPSVSETPTATSTPTERPKPTPTWTPEPATSFFVNVRLLLWDASHLGMSPGDACRGDGGFEDIHVGAQVVLLSGETTLDLAELTGGSIAKPADPEATGLLPCEFGFGFLVPIDEDHEFYTFKVGRRSTPVYRQQDFTGVVTMELGR